MKAGIITFHRAVNIGAALQTFALFNYISKNVCDVEVIDYAPNNLLVPKSKLAGRVKNRAKILLHRVDRNSIARQKKFSDFLNRHIAMSSITYHGDSEIFAKPPQYDLLISGSDQILNTTLSGNSKAYYLGFSCNTRKITYGSSFGRSQLSDFELNCIREELPKFEAISCRERQGKTIIEHEIHKECDIVADPVFLLRKDEWRCVCSSPNIHKQEYIFVYVMEVNQTVINVVEDAKKRYGLPAIVVYGGSDRTGISGSVDFCCGPEDFIKYIDNASAVVTNSFHGAAFSLIFGKPLITIAHSTRNDRLEHLFDEAGIKDKLIREWDEGIINDCVVGGDAYKNLEPLIEHSKEFLHGYYDKNRKTISERPSVYTTIDACTGCSACAAVCPVNAIIMVRDEKGFLHPEVTENCVHCNRCVNTCQIKSAEAIKHPISQLCYGFKAEDEYRIASSSGAFYAKLAEAFLKQGNSVVISAKYSTQFSVEHHAFSSYEDISATRGSKYAQSDFSNVYNQVTKCLLDDKKVLIVGTPCQITGLRMYLKQKKISEEHLLFVDIVCHGVSSPKVWLQYVDTIREHYGIIKDITLRDKSKGWRGYHAAAYTVNGLAINDDAGLLSLYPDLLTYDLILRPCCFQCEHAHLSRCGDITIGDFWEIANGEKDFVDKLGVSMVLPNTDKGKKWVETILSDDHVVARQYPVSILGQHNLFKPTEEGFGYDRFWRLFDKNGLIGTCKRMGLYGTFHGGYLISKKAFRKIKKVISL